MAMELDLGNSLSYLKSVGSVENTFQHICGQDIRGLDSNVDKTWLNVCNVVKNSDACKSIPDEKRITCTEDNYELNEIDYASFDFLYNCLWGAGEAIVNLLVYMKDLVTGIVKMTYDKEYRSEKKGEYTALIDSVMAYISLEYAKTLDETGSELEASAAVLSSVMKQLFSGIADSMEKEYFGLGCLKLESRQAKICESITSYIVPTFGVLKILSKTKSGIINKLQSSRSAKIGHTELRGSTGKQYDAISTLPKVYNNEEKGHVFPTMVEYLNSNDRKPYEVFIGKEGRLYDVMGDPIDTRKASIIGGKTVGIYVMSPEGKIYLSNSQVVGKFHHSSFLAGGDVAVAGELIVHNGILMAVNRHSGHYRPEKKQLRQFMQEIKGRGGDITLTKVDTKVPNE
jgi:hypothetical protein